MKKLAVLKFVLAISMVFLVSFVIYRILLGLYTTICTIYGIRIFTITTTILVIAGIDFIISTFLSRKILFNEEK